MVVTPTRPLTAAWCLLYFKDIACAIYLIEALGEEIQFDIAILSEHTHEK